MSKTAAKEPIRSDSGASLGLEVYMGHMVARQIFIRATEKSTDASMHSDAKFSDDANCVTTRSLGLGVNLLRDHGTLPTKKLPIM